MYAIVQTVKAKLILASLHTVNKAVLLTSKDFSAGNDCEQQQRRYCASTKLFSNTQISASEINFSAHQQIKQSGELLAENGGCPQAKTPACASRFGARTAMYWNFQ